MEKYILCALIHLCAIQALMADDLNPAQLKLRSEIQTFLKEEGYMPKIDSDGDIKFEMEDIIYYISVSPEEVLPMYVHFYCVFPYSNGLTHDALTFASAVFNHYKGIKVVCAEDSFAISHDMFLTSADTFNYAFYRLKSLFTIVQEEIGAVPFLVTTMKVGISDNSNNTIVKPGNTLFSSQTKYFVPQITVAPLKGSGTYTVYVKLYKGDNLQTGSNSPSGYSYSETIKLNGSSGQTLTLKGWGSNTSGFWGSGAYRFEVWYDDYCIGSKSFTVY